MDWDDLSKHKIPEDKQIGELYTEIQEQIDMLNTKYGEVSAHNGDGDYDDAIRDILSCMNRLEDSIGYTLHIVSRMLQVYPFGSNELAARVLERLNATGELTLPEPPDIEIGFGS